MPFESLETPYLLLAAPEMQDPNFSRSVVLMGHHTSEGALGWIVNRVLDRKVSELLPDPLVSDVHPDTPLRLGGPVLTNGLVALFRTEVPEVEQVEMAPGVKLSASPAILRPLFGADPSASRPVGLLVYGYSGWGPGQLEHEMEEGAWLVLPYEEAFAFPDPGETSTLWERALARLGLRPESVSMPSGGVS